MTHPIKPGQTVDAYLAEHGGGGGGGGGGPQVGDVQWVTNSVGLLEEQAWTGSRWIATGQVRNPIDTGGPGTTGSTGAAPPAWRPGELELEQKALEQRLEELRLRGDQDAKAAILAHENALKLLELELASASELQKERIQAEINLENMRHENDLAELRERIEAEGKMLIFGESKATERTLIEQQGAMGRELLKLGEDPMVQAAGITGQATRGITPQQMTVGRAREFMGIRSPQVNMGMSLPQMEAALGGAQGAQPPSLAGPFVGMKHGGIIEMEKKDGKFGRKQTVLVGEAGPEVLTVDKGKVEVTPLTGAAQFGGRIGGIGTTTADQPIGFEPWPGFAGGAPNPLDAPAFGVWPGTSNPLWPKPPPALQTTPLAQSILQGLAPMFAGSPFGQVPTAADYGMGYELPSGDWVGGFGFTEEGTPVGPGLTGALGPNAPITFNPQGMSTMGAFGELGIAPQLIRSPAGNVFFIQGGKRHYVPGGHNPETLVSLGLNPSQVVNVSSAEVRSFSQGSLFTGQGVQAAGAVTGTTGGYGAFGVPLIEPTSGALLMNPKDIAASWSGFSPVQQANFLSAYQAAGGPASSTGFGLSPETVQDILQTFTPAGRGFGRRIGGIGAQF